MDFKSLADELLPKDAGYDSCISCGLCSSGCPAAGFFGMGPQHFVRMAVLGLNRELIATPWVWTCTQCKRCLYVCPMSIDVSILVGAARGAWAKKDKPRGITRSCRAQEINPGPSAMGLTSEDFQEIVRDVVHEIRDEDPRFADLAVPFDKKGVELVINQNSREPGVEAEEMGPLWKILHYVGADWCYTSKGWAAENFCMTGIARASPSPCKIPVSWSENPWVIRWPTTCVSSLKNWWAGKISSICSPVEAATTVAAAAAVFCRRA